MIRDREIIDTLNKDKHAGFKILFDRYYRPMCVFGARYIASLDVVEDIVQEVLMNVWNRDRYVDLSRLRSYLFTAVKNKCISHIKKIKPDYIDELEVSWEKDLFIAVDDEELVNTKIKEAKKAISELPSGCRMVFESVVINRSKYRETAEDLGISVNTVKSQLKRAYRLLDKNLSLVVLMLIAK